MAFYKNDNNCLVWSKDLLSNGTVLESKKDIDNHPIEGWIWADTELEARLALECYGNQPFSSWVLNMETAEWNAPTPAPIEEGKLFLWDEPTLSWKESTE